MSSSKTRWLPLVLMVVGITMLATSAWWALQRKTVVVSPVAKPLQATAFYRPAESDWWLYFGAQSGLIAAAVAAVPALDPATPALPSGFPMPVAMAAAGHLRMWQFAAGTALVSPPVADDLNARWHIETLADANLLFWLPEDVSTTAVDRVAEPLAETGRIRRSWLQQRLDWPSTSCDTLPLLLAQLPDDAQIHVQQGPYGLEWQILWPTLPASLNAVLQGAGAPQASAAANDDWHWREADLTALARPVGCKASTSPTGGFIARLWQQGDETSAALARLGANQVQGFPLPLPPELTMKSVQLQHGAGVASSEQALSWLTQQSLLPEPGLLLAIKHRRSDDFAGLELRLQSLPPTGLQLRWQWPLP